MKTFLINVDSRASEKQFLTLARKLRLRTRVLKVQDREDSALLALMDERKDDKTFPVSTTYALLRKVK